MVRSAPLQRLDTLTHDVTVLESDIANIDANVAILQLDTGNLESNVANLQLETSNLESNVAALQLDVANLNVMHVVETANVTANLILNSANGVAYYLRVDDGGNLTTVSVT
jgi:acetoacetate decarboxylase